MAERKKWAVWGAAILTIGITGYSLWRQFVQGVLSWHLHQMEFVSMVLELLVVWLLLFLAFSAMGTKKREKIGMISVCAILLGFIWLHKLLLPIVFTGAYVSYLVLVGMWFCREILKKELDPNWNFLMGSAVTILCFCVLSLFQIGSIRNLRIWVIGSGFVLVVWGLKKRKELFYRKESESVGRIGCMMLAAIVTLVLLQAGRMNLAVDFDSIWYGVRSDTMLNSGNGIYEDLKTLGVVYTYSKGFETLLLPLAGLPSYSFTTAMNLWIAVFLLYALYQTVRISLPRKQALWAPFLLAAVPGVMNMADTAKADLFTVFCQLLMVQGVLRCIRVNAQVQEQVPAQAQITADWLVAGLAAGGMSLALKPTAMVYSPAIVGMSFLWFLRKYGTSIRCMKTEYKRVWLMFFLAAGVLAGIWGRTLKLVGVPVTSIFYGVFQKLGFQVKYPFYASGFPSAGSSWKFTEQVLFLAKRLYGVLLDPQGEDMAHVIIAWGTVLPVAIFLCWIFWRGFVKERDAVQKSVSSYLLWLLLPIGAVNLISLYSLSQIDGNYYMLYYVLIVLAAVIWTGSLREDLQVMWKRVMIPVWIYGACFCGLTNWAWALGNGGLDPINRGYYPHQALERQKRAEQGSEAIWNIFAADPKNRVIALGEVPDVLTFPCWVQSYVDVSGYWGNPEVVSNEVSFLDYLHFAEVDYLYMERGYIDVSVGIYQIIRSLVESGWLYDVRNENGNLILSVRKQTTEDPISMVSPGEKMENLKVFDWGYIQHR